MAITTSFHSLFSERDDVVIATLFLSLHNDVYNLAVLTTLFLSLSSNRNNVAIAALSLVSLGSN